jgi:hypothetical protein
MEALGDKMDAPDLAPSAHFAPLMHRPKHLARTEALAWLKRLAVAKKLEARGGIEPPIKVLQTFALPLGDRADHSGNTCNEIRS